MAEPATTQSGAHREQRPITALRGVGPALAERLHHLGVSQVQDLLFVLPSRYEDRTHLWKIGELTPGARATVEGEVQLTEVVFRRRRQLLCKIADSSGFLTLRFFHFTTAQQNGLTRGARVRCFGEIRRGPFGLEITHPEYQRVFGNQPVALEESLTPIYPLTEGVTQGRLRALVAQAMREVDTAAVRDWVPTQLIQPLGLPSLQDALSFVHRPPRATQLSELDGHHPAQRRLAFEELLAHQVSLKLRKRAAKIESAWPLTDTEQLERRFLEALPFQLTRAQARALSEVDADISSESPMVRLVQGDVGCGKTVVAAAAAARAAGAGYQAVLMAPTELLAEQHFANFRRWFAGLTLREGNRVVDVGRIHGSLPARERRSTLESIAAGDIRVVVGTHALFQEGVEFDKLALVIVDEQHRFGVQQRLLLQEKGRRSGRLPHQLIMTATPIPRTLAMTSYADLDVSVIDELPPGRTPVKTVVVTEQRRDEVVARIAQSCGQGRQAYWVCPLIDESEEIESQAAEEMAIALKAALPAVQVGLVHGRMPPAKKDAAMLAFKAGKIQLLVSTTVIEVGVDVPNATTMVIENSERMGLAQLHQLRGRVGRGSEASTCLLLYKAPLAPLAKERLRVIRETNDGFQIAERDLILRGPGELLGTRQTGVAQMRVADVVRDRDLIPEVDKAAELLLQQADPANIAALTARWIGSDEQYGRIG